MREIVRNVQTARKDAGLNVDDRIKLSLQSADVELKEVIDEHQEVILAETLAVELLTEDLAYSVEVKVENFSLKISLQKQ